MMCPIMVLLFIGLGSALIPASVVLLAVGLQMCASGYTCVARVLYVLAGILFVIGIGVFCKAYQYLQSQKELIITVTPSSRCNNRSLLRRILKRFRRQST
jgi:hypothetical protein